MSVEGKPLSLLLATVLVACSGAVPSAPGGSASGTAVSRPAASGTSAGTAPAPPTKLTVGLGFVASVQFAQFYLAQQAGYYRDAGLDVTLQNKIDPELITLVGQGAVDIASADGTSVIAAVSQGIPVRYVATIYATFPSVVFTRASSGIRSPADLKGRKLGTPGKFGTSWIMLQALLRSAGLTPDDLQIVPFPDFGQRVALQRGVVDAATGFANNEPVQLELSGEKPVVFHVDPVTPLPGPGLVTGVATLGGKREALRSFVAATLRAMQEIIQDPEKGLDAAVATVPELGRDRTTQRAILKATIATWQSEYTRQHGLGAINATAWTKSVEFMRSLPDTAVARPVTVNQLVTDELLQR
ncbi:MAG: ABC transporter substrate-binding protein [Chloroflexota bacterium]|nr:ABC transporter substrate-binding protein [Chloroflexota bacterium]